jgi:uncharacterized protein YktB (UPF0637 family)
MTFFRKYPHFKCGLFLTIHMVFLVIGFILQGGGSAEYGGAILRETKEWNEGVITDVQSV